MWEVSFYRSLSDSDGLILLGGAKSTEIAGQVAIGARIPILALAATGGAASTVWKTIAAGPDLPTVDEHARMAHALSDESVSRWVDSLEAQRRRRFAVESGPILWHAVFAASFFALALGLALASCLIPKLLPGIATAFVIASTLLAGAAGAAIRMVFERRYGAGPLVPPSMAITFALGGMAGAIAGLLYVVAQPGALTFTGDAGLRLVASLVVIGTIAGLTVETIFRKLLGVDVLQTRSIAVGGAARDGTPPRGGP
jgi:hypothetical protein